MNVPNVTKPVETMTGSFRKTSRLKRSVLWSYSIEKMTSDVHFARKYTSEYAKSDESIR